MQAEGTSAESVAALARVDAVKQRMEAAHETLQVDINPHFLLHFLLTNHSALYIGKGLQLDSVSWSYHQCTSAGKLSVCEYSKSSFLHLPVHVCECGLIMSSFCKHESSYREVARVVARDK